MTRKTLQTHSEPTSARRIFTLMHNTLQRAVSITRFGPNPRRQSVKPARTAPLFGLPAIAIMVLISGCATNTAPLSSRTHTLYLNRTSISVPATVRYETNGEKWGRAIGGLIGGAIAGSSQDDTDAQLKDFLTRQGPTYGQHYADAMTAAFSKDPRFKLVPNKGGDELRLSILEYGLHPDAALKDTMLFEMKVRAEIFGPSGQLIWKKDSGSQHAGLTGHYAQDYLANKALLEDAVKAACADMANRLLASLNAKAPAGY
jgi:hypothetical protein